MTELRADEYEFRIAPVEPHDVDYHGEVSPGPPVGEGWFLFSTVPLAQGGGSYMTGPAGQDHRINSVGTRVVGVWARRISLVARRERLALALEQAALNWRTRADGLRMADLRAQQAIAMRQGWFRFDYPAATIRGELW